MTLRQMKPARLAELRELVASGSTGFVSFALIRDLLADRDWHRKRVQITTDDIRRAGVTWEHVQAYGRTAGTTFSSHDLERPDWADSDQHERNGHGMLLLIESMIQLAAIHRRQPQLDALAAIRDALK